MQDLRERIDAAKLPEHVAQGGHARGRSPRTHAAGVARISDDPHLHRLGARRPVVEDDRGSAESGRGAPRARRRPLRSRQGQGAHRRIPRRAQAEGGHERSHPLLRRPSGRRQDVARPVDRARDESRVRAHLARRRARRSGDPRPSPHLHRLDARPPDSGAEAGGLRQSGVHARRDRQDGGRLSRAIRRRRCSRCSTRRRTTASAITIWKCRSISRACCSSRRRISSARSIRRCSIAWRSSRSTGYTEEDKVHIARRYLLPRQLSENGLPATGAGAERRGAAPRDCGIHARGRRPQPRTSARHDRAQGRGARGRRAAGADASAPRRRGADGRGGARCGRIRCPRRRRFRSRRHHGGRQRAATRDARTVAQTVVTTQAAANIPTTVVDADSRAGVSRASRASVRKSRSARHGPASRPASRGPKAAATCCSSKPRCCRADTATSS